MSFSRNSTNPSELNEPYFIPVSDVDVVAPTLEKNLTLTLRGKAGINFDISGVYFPPFNDQNPYFGSHLVTVEDQRLGAMNQDLIKRQAQEIVDNVDPNSESKLLQESFASRLFEIHNKYLESSLYRRSLKRVFTIHEYAHRMQEIRFGLVSLDQRVGEALEDRPVSYVDRKDTNLRAARYEMEVFAEVQASTVGILHSGVRNAEVLHDTVVIQMANYIEFFVPGYLENLIGAISNDNLDRLQGILDPHSVAWLIILSGNANILEDIKLGNIDARSLRNNLASNFAKALADPNFLIGSMSQKEFQVGVDRNIMISKQKTEHALGNFLESKDNADSDDDVGKGFEWKWG